MENGPSIDDFPIKTSIYEGFSMAMLNNQMVYIYIYSNPRKDGKLETWKFLGENIIYTIPQTGLLFFKVDISVCVYIYMYRYY